MILFLPWYENWGTRGQNMWRETEDNNKYSNRVIFDFYIFCLFFHPLPQVCSKFELDWIVSNHPFPFLRKGFTI